MKTPCYLVLMCLLSSGCAQRSTYFEANSDIDKTFFYYEQDRYNQKHALSNTTLDTREPIRIPNPGLVDLDSFIHIQVNKESGTSRDGILVPNASDLLEQKQAFQALLSSLDQVIVTRERALAAYRQDSSRFVEARRASGQATLAFIGQLRKLYPDRSSQEYKTLSLAAKDKTMATLRGLLQARLDAINHADQTWINDTKTQASTLRLQAFLERGNKEKMPIHLEGYDTIPEGTLNTINRSGLNLSDQEKARLDEQIKATSNLAHTLNQLKDREISLNQGLIKTLSIASDDLAKVLNDLETLSKQLLDPKRYTSLEESIKAFLDMVKVNQAAMTEEITTKLENMPSLFQEKLKQECLIVTNALTIVSEAKNLEYRFSTDRKPEELASLLTETSDLANKLRTSIQTLSLPKDLKPITKAFLLQQAKDLHQDVLTAFDEVIESQEAQDLLLELNRLQDDIAAGIDLTMHILDLLQIGEVQPVLGTPDVPEVLDVNFTELEDTYLNLNKVPGQPGDLITVKATLKQSHTTEKSSEASFKLTRYGWYADLSPSVVLVRPNQQAGASNSFQFAPALSWNHHYYPRPQQNPSWTITALENLQPAVGIHAAFLPYDLENNAEIGLGATLSFWNNRLIFGAGYNLMADSRDDGQTYFFVGSDLIGLLQSIGIGGKN